MVVYAIGIRSYVNSIRMVFRARGGAGSPSRGQDTARGNGHITRRTRATSGRGCPGPKGDHRCFGREFVPGTGRGINHHSQQAGEQDVEGEDAALHLAPHLEGGRLVAVQLELQDVVALPLQAQGRRGGVIADRGIGRDSGLIRGRGGGDGLAGAVEDGAATGGGGRGCPRGQGFQEDGEGV